MLHNWAALVRHTKAFAKFNASLQEMLSRQETYADQHVATGGSRDEFYEENLLATYDLDLARRLFPARISYSRRMKRYVWSGDDYVRDVPESADADLAAATRIFLSMFDELRLQAKRERSHEKANKAAFALGGGHLEKIPCNASWPTANTPGPCEVPRFVPRSLARSPHNE